eukprot:comp12634_c0_seq1/m.7683 comp12634_c0_seq1/g.7683  ORF comp12634_c0_seq1/g.7683 comp12634_c0_seq1/m.7683 type:complete len:137 (-) comp12634_c0_seq1:34-444(-)
MTAFSRGALQHVDRYVSQLRQLSLNYCRGECSEGLRTFIDKNAVEFAKANPQVLVHAVRSTQPRPYIEAHYVNGHVEKVDVNHKDFKAVAKTVESLKNAAGRKPQRLTKWWHTDRPSVQGEWNPFMNQQSYFGNQQ